MPRNIGPDIDTLRADALVAVDEAAGRARTRFVSPGALVTEEYRQAAQAVTDWRAAGSPADAVPAEVVDGADYSNISIEASADEIEATAAAFATGLQWIRQRRLTAKRVIRTATDDAVIATTRNAAVSDMEALVPAAG